MVKRIGLLCGVAVLTVLMTGALAAATAHAGISFRVYGGYSMLNPTDYNNYLEGQANQGIASGGGSATVNNLTYAIPYGVDVRLGTNPGLLLSLGFTGFSGKAGFSWENAFWGETLERVDTISVMGGLGSVLYALGSDSYSVYFGGGAGYYMVNLKKTIPVEEVWWWNEYEYAAKKNQLGFHGLGGFQFFLSENIALGAEIIYRVLTIPEMTFTEHDIPAWVGETWNQKLNLSGINILAGINIYI